MELSGIRAFISNSPVTATSVGVGIVTVVALLALEGVKLFAGQSFSFHGHSAVELTGIIGASTAGGIFVGGLLAQFIYRKYQEARIERQQKQAKAESEKASPEMPKGSEGIKLLSAAREPLLHATVTTHGGEDDFEAFLRLADEPLPPSLESRWESPVPVRRESSPAPDKEGIFENDPVADSDTAPGAIAIPQSSSALTTSGKKVPSPPPAELVISAHTLSRYSRYIE